MQPEISEKSCGIVIKDNKLLFYKEQINDQSKTMGFILKLPWGKVDEWETAEKALIREFQEECSLQLLPSQYNHIWTIDWPLFRKWTKVINGISRLQLFLCSLLDTEIVPQEASIIWTHYLTANEIKDGVSNWSIQEIASAVASILIEKQLLF